MSSRIGIGLWSLQQLSFLRGTKLPEILEIIAGLHVDGVDIYEEYIPCHPVEMHELVQVKKLAGKLGLPITGTWFMNDIVAGVHASSVETVAENLKSNLAVTAALGARYMSIPFLLNVPGLTLKTAYETAVHVLEIVLPTAQEYDVRIAHETARQHTSGLALKIRKELRSDFYTICPDLEAWRLDTADIPLQHAETPNAPKPQPESIELFAQCLTHSPYIHFKLLALDEHGEEPHFPIPEIMDLINRSEREHYLCIEYEGWIPDLRPHLDAAAETRKCVELIRRYQR